MSRIRASNKWEDRENMVKEKLRAYRTLVRDHQSCCELFERLFPKMTGQIYPDKVITSRQNTNEDNIIKKIDLETQMMASLQAMRLETELIFEKMNALPPDEHVVMIRRYALAESMEVIAEDLKYSVRHCWRLHQSAIQMIAKHVSDLQWES